MVNALAFALSRLRLNPGQDIVSCAFGKKFHSHSAPLSTQVYKMVLANLMLGDNPAVD